MHQAISYCDSNRVHVICPASFMALSAWIKAVQIICSAGIVSLVLRGHDEWWQAHIPEMPIFPPTCNNVWATDGKEVEALETKKKKQKQKKNRNMQLSIDLSIIKDVLYRSQGHNIYVRMARRQDWYILVKWQTDGKRWLFGISFMVKAATHCWKASSYYVSYSYSQA